MSRRTYTQNAFETQLASAITAGSASVVLQTAVGLQDPGYLVLDPDSPTKREFFRFEQLTGSTLENLTRGMEGSAAGAQAHDVGTPVRTMSTKQELDDLFSDVEDLEQWDTDHVADATPHPALDSRYLLLSGGTMTGKITLDGAPSVDLHAATKKYVDDSSAGTAPIPSGSRMIFDQDTAPVGWTRDTSTVNDKVIRIVTGTRADGGTWTQPDHTHSGPSHSHTQGIDAAAGSHTHTVNSHAHTLATAQSILAGTGSSRFFADTGNTGSSSPPTNNTGTHQHSPGSTSAAGTGATSGSATASSWRPLHRDMIIAVAN